MRTATAASQPSTSIGKLRCAIHTTTTVKNVTGQVLVFHKRSLTVHQSQNGRRKYHNIADQSDKPFDQNFCVKLGLCKFPLYIFTRRNCYKLPFGVVFKVS